MCVNKYKGLTGKGGPVHTKIDLKSDLKRYRLKINLFSDIKT